LQDEITGFCERMQGLLQKYYIFEVINIFKIIRLQLFKILFILIGISNAMQESTDLCSGSCPVVLAGSE